MLQSTTRLILFAVGSVLSNVKIILGAIGLFVFTGTRVAIIVLLLWGFILWAITGRKYPHDNTLLWMGLFFVALVVSLAQSVLAGLPQALYAGQY